MTSLALPPFIMTSEKDSFARNTIAVRKPLIIDQILVDNDFPGNVQEALLRLKTELISGKVRQLIEDTEDRSIWDHDIQPWQGKSWLEIPWFLAETYFFRRVLEATGYFQSGLWERRDPYHILKQKELAKAFPLFASSYHHTPHEKSLEGFTQVVQDALWGNQSDLSNLDRKIGSSPSSGGQNQLIRDDSSEVFNLFHEQSAKVIYFMDNVGKELFFDLALIDYLIKNNFTSSLTVMLKNQPFFVSDVLSTDFEEALDYLSKTTEKATRELSQRVRNYLFQGKLKLSAPPFLTTGRMFRQLPNELKAQLREADLAILKGDLNYRRLVGDRHWDPTTPVGRAAGYFPTSFMSLRTLKAELVVGLSQEQVNWFAEHAEPDWMTSGKWGLITFLEK